ncbi:MAG: DUF2141 domain-containing protein [Pedobacter sp.]|nr:DUF2141 domain-containing protein [Pedobacter sp.]
MKFILLLFLVLFAGSAHAQSTDANTLKITITNIKKVKGSLELGIFNNPKLFLEKNKAFKNISEKINKDTMTIILSGLKKGDYAIALYQDLNSDHTCNMNFLGIPTEPYGFSRNFKPVLSKPTFNDCKISLNENKSITIKLVD